MRRVCGVFRSPNFLLCDFSEYPDFWVSVEVSDYPMQVEKAQFSVDSNERLTHNDFNRTADADSERASTGTPAY